MRKVSIPLEGPLTVLAVLPGITARGGAEQSFSALAPLLLESGIQLHLALLTTRNSAAPDLARKGVAIHDLSANSTIATRTRALRRLIAELEPALVHATLFEAALPAQLAKIGTGTPILVTWAGIPYVKERNNEAGIDPRKLQVLRLLEIAVGRAAKTNYHAVTSGVARVNGASMRVPPSRIFVGERGRSLGAFERPSDSFDELRDSIGVPRKSPLILAIGRQEPVKGFDVLLKAFDQLLPSEDAPHLVLVGRTGSDTERLQRLLPTLESEARIHFLGHRDDIADLLGAADLIVCSSWREGAAGALIEAMAAKVPIVTVPLDGLEDVLQDDYNAIVVDRNGLSYGIGLVLSDSDLADRIAKAAFETFNARFTVERSAARMGEIYRLVSRV